MRAFYATAPYHSEWIKGYNSRWTTGQHDAQLQMCQYVPPGARLLEVGCGDGCAEPELRSRIPGLNYTGVDMKSQPWPHRSQFAAAEASQLPFQSRSMDVVVAMFVLEHLVYPRMFLDEAWRILRPDGRLLLVSPDFANGPMASEWVGTSYGCGQDKLTRGRWADALLTAFDSRLRIKAIRLTRSRQLGRGSGRFPVLLHPRCLYFEGFVPDCDAVYPSCPEEVINHLRAKPRYRDAAIFHRKAGTFGLAVWKI
jgi:SAM-dependent methyltransferase